MEVPRNPSGKTRAASRRNAIRDTPWEPAPAIQAKETPPQNATAFRQKHARKTRRRLERNREVEEEEEKHSRNGKPNPHILSASQLVCDMAAAPAARRPGAAP
jgi:hypothetical protein